MPTRDAISSAPISGRGRSGSITSRLGSRVSSPLGKNSGITAQPSASTAVSSTTSEPAWALPRSAISPMTWPAAISRVTTTDEM